MSYPYKERGHCGTGVDAAMQHDTDQHEETQVTFFCRSPKTGYGKNGEGKVHEGDKKKTGLYSGHNTERKGAKK